MYGVNPDFGRKVDVDMSEERMQKAWEAYKIRWENEADDLRVLEEKKLVISYFEQMNAVYPSISHRNFTVYNKGFL